MASSMLIYASLTLSCLLQFRRVIDKIRGRSYADALYNLTRLPYRAVEEITEVLKSVSKAVCCLKIQFVQDVKN